MSLMSLTDHWDSWLSAHPPDYHRHLPEHMLSLRTFMRECVTELRSDGYLIIRVHKHSRTMSDILADGLEPLRPHGTEDHTTGVSFEHLLNMVWLPVLQYFEALATGDNVEWTSGHEKNNAAVLLEMQGIVMGTGEVLTMDAWVAFVKATLLRLVDVEPPSILVEHVAKHLVPLNVLPTRANAVHLLRSSLAAKLVGPTLAKQVNRKLLSEISESTIPLLSAAELSTGVKKDHVDLLAKPYIVDDEDHQARSAKRFRRDNSSRAMHLSDKTSQVLWALDNKVKLWKAKDTLDTSLQLYQSLQEGDPVSFAEDLFDGKKALRQHLMYLDGALDRQRADIIYNLREKGRFAGVAIATDESPPRAPRFRGLRFQITVLYLGTFAPLDSWDTSEDPPLMVTSMLGDIMHCPGKQGADISRVLDRQLARVGLNAFDVVAGTGDGGGENEGQLGIHAHFEALSPGYVRHRCLPHMAWRTADMAIKESLLDYKALASYFTEGSTWNRLKVIATSSRAEGGLGLFADGSRACQDIFSRRPSAIIDTRPDSDLQFLKLLKGKEHVFFDLAVRDLNQRDLGPKTRTAVMSLGDIEQRINRTLLAELIERCFFLLHYNQSEHTRIASGTSWDLLVSQASHKVLDLNLTEQVIRRLGSSPEEVAAMDRQPRTWVELAVFRVLRDWGLVDTRLPTALDFCRRVSGKAAAHLALLGDNTYRTTWMAAKMLSKEPQQAREAARTLRRHLASTKPGNRTVFEEHIFESEHLWQDIVDFADMEPPVRLWQGQGRCQNLFKFMAPRFLLAPDHVLDCERIHARWQWALHVQRALLLPGLNAQLRVTHFVENNLFFPNHEDLEEHLVAEREWHRLSVKDLDDEVAPRARSGESELGNTIQTKANYYHYYYHHDYHCYYQDCYYYYYYYDYDYDYDYDYYYYY